MGRFLSEDPHWNIDNMIYEDKQQNQVNSNNYSQHDVIDNKLNEKQPLKNAIIQSINLYTYCVNNPIKHLDPTGLDVGKMETEMDVGSGITVKIIIIYEYEWNDDYARYEVTKVNSVTSYSTTEHRDIIVSYEQKSSYGNIKYDIKENIYKISYHIDYTHTILLKALHKELDDEIPIYNLSN